MIKLSPLWLFDFAFVRTRRFWSWSGWCDELGRSHKLFDTFYPARTSLVDDISSVWSPWDKDLRSRLCDSIDACHIRVVMRDFKAAKWCVTWWRYTCALGWLCTIYNVSCILTYKQTLSSSIYIYSFGDKPRWSRVISIFWVCLP